MTALELYQIAGEVLRDEGTSQGLTGLPGM